jgi:phytoene dehydrogenase-like protein
MSAGFGKVMMKNLSYDAVIVSAGHNGLVAACYLAQAGTWGVETKFENVLICGSSARRCGALSGIPGHNVAMYVLGRRRA